MRGLVREERELGEDDAEDAGDDELVPAVAEQHESGDGGAERDQDDPEDHRIEPGAPAQEPGIANRSQQAGVFGGRIRSVSARPRPGEGDNGS